MSRAILHAREGEEATKKTRGGGRVEAADIVHRRTRLTGPGRGAFAAQSSRQFCLKFIVDIKVRQKMWEPRKKEGGARRRRCSHTGRKRGRRSNQVGCP